MGLKVPDPPDDYEFGDDCLWCFPPGKTPNYVWIRFWDIVTCPGKQAPPNGYPFVCKQDPGHPCWYHGEIKFGGWTWGVWYISFIWKELPTTHKCELALTCTKPGCVASFYDYTEACAVDFENELTCAHGFEGEGGHAHVTTYIDPIIIALTSHYHFATIPGVLYEHNDCGMDHAWYKLNHRSDKTNVLILLDKEELQLPW